MKKKTTSPSNISGHQELSGDTQYAANALVFITHIGAFVRGCIVLLHQPSWPQILGILGRLWSVKMVPLRQC